jgi:hypothetical protein
MAEALRNKLLGQECLCKSTHNASLILELRTAHKRSKCHYFHVIFGFDIAAISTSLPPWTNREMEIKALEESLLSTDETLPNEPPLDDTLAPTITIEDISNQDASSTTSKANDSPPKKSILKDLFRSRNLTHDSFRSHGKNGINLATVAPQVTQTGSAPEQVQRVMFELPKEQKQQSTAKEIENLCAAISEAGNKTAWCGILTAHPQRLQEIRIATKSYFTSDNVKEVSLADVLSAEIWKTKPRSKLSLQLASTVLQLYQTPWLGDNWGKEDIFFIQQSDGTVLIDKPFLRPRYPPLATTETKVKPEAVTINMNVPCLFALGVVLIELHYKKSIDVLQKEDAGFVVHPNEVYSPPHSLNYVLLRSTIANILKGARSYSSQKNTSDVTTHRENGCRRQSRESHEAVYQRARWRADRLKYRGIA